MSECHRSGINPFAAAIALLPVTFFAACGDSTAAPPPDPPRATTIIVSPGTAELAALGATVQLLAEVRDQNGQAMAGATVNWASSAAAVATVGASGLVTAVANGSATITAASGAASGRAIVTVAQEVSTVAVAPDMATVVEGDTVRLAATATDANGQVVTGVEFVWAAGDTALAVVDASGLVTGVGTGQTEVSATTGGIAGRAQVTVVTPAPTAIAVTPDTVLLTALGQDTRLTAEVRDQLGRLMENQSVVWASSDSMVATVDSTGLVAARTNGTAAITATAGSASGTALVGVRQSVRSATVSPAADTVVLGDTLRLIAEAYDENGHVVQGAAFTWSSNNVPVAWADPSGLVWGAAEGSATITANAGDASGTSAVTVVSPDRPALVALYEATDGQNWVNNDNWLSDAPLADWYGVDADGDGRVVYIGLGGTWDSDAQEWVRHGLSGPIPAELGTLSRLRRLHLDRNQLTGEIPAELSGLAGLLSLYLSANQLTGSIPPEFGDLANLESLRLNDNSKLAGALPLSLASLSALDEFWYYGTGLYAPADESFRAWLNGIADHQGDSQILGSVTVENIGLSGVRVHLSGASSATTTTDNSGRYAFAGLVAGDYTVGMSDYNADEFEFEITSKDVTLARGQTSVVNFMGQVAPVIAGSLSVRTVYAIPRNRGFVKAYSDSVGAALRHLQVWYRDQMDGLTFALADRIPEVCRLSVDDDFLTVHPGNAGERWHAALDAVSGCGPKHRDEAFIWIVYFDVDEPCWTDERPQTLGRGGDGLTMLGRWDLLGLTSRDFEHPCGHGGHPHGRWVGGLGHELGHAFGLPHPPGCESGRPTCDIEALMWLGYARWPDTYLREDERAILRESPFFKNR